MPDEPQKTEIVGEVKIAPADGVKVEAPTTAQTTTKTEKTEVVSGAPPPPPIVADDAIRKELARAVILSDTVTCLAILMLLFFFGNGMSKDVLAIVGTIVGSIIGYRARDTATVMGYEFGSSSGSTAKDYIKK